jgi:hypothetical protein
VRFSMILRVEHLWNHLGPYARYDEAPEPLRAMIELHGGESSEAHPTLPFDTLLAQKQLRPSPFWPSHPTRRFGFRSWDQLFLWFSIEELRMLERYGFRVMEYAVMPFRVFHGSKQSIFDSRGVYSRKSATRELHGMPSWRT